MNMIEIAQKVTKTTGILIDIYGFDTGKGMPEPIDFRDHPEYYNTGDFPMNKDLLEKRIDGKATLIYGPIKDTITDFKTLLKEESPIGFVSIDVDYYSSTVEVFELFKLQPELFLPLTYAYFDDIFMPHHNEKCGELLAIKEFIENQENRNLQQHTFLVNQRLFKNANWIKQFYYFHILDYDFSFNLNRNIFVNVLDNPFLK